jgi:hypothetical protein
MLQKKRRCDLDSALTSFKSIIPFEDKKDFMDLTFANIILSYFKKQNIYPKNDNEFFFELNRIINDISMDKNEFILFTLLFDEYKKVIGDNFNLKNIFYLCLCSKRKINEKFSDIFEKYKKNDNDFREWEDKNKNKIQFEVPIHKFNKRYKELSYKNNILNKSRVTDYEKLLDYICDKEVKVKRKEKKKFNSNKNNDIQKANSSIIDNNIKIEISQREDTQKSGFLDINTNNNIKAEEDKYNFINNINAFFLKDNLNDSKKNDIPPLNDEGSNMQCFDSFSFQSYLFQMENNLFEDTMDYLFDKYYADFFGYENNYKNFLFEL